jgi:hypothetical protein
MFKIFFNFPELNKYRLQERVLFMNEPFKKYHVFIAP